MPLEAFAERIWIAEGETVQFLGLPYNTRMTVVRLPGGALWLHSPIALTPELLTAVQELGTVRYLIAPNKIHHLFLSEWCRAFPDALLFAAPGLATKRKDLLFNRELQDQPEPEWQEELDQLIFRGSFAMQEVVFFHQPSRTLIVTDLIENFDPKHFTRLQRLVAKATGILAPDGKMPIDWRMSFLFGKSQARACYERMQDWAPDNIILAHGECITEQASDWLAHSFRWL